MSILVTVFSFRPTRWLAALAWSILLSVLLLQPESDPLINLGLPSGPQTLAREAFFTTVHVIAFALTCALWFWAWHGHSGFRGSLALGCAIAIVLGAATEFLQSFAPDRYPSSIDLIANIFGTILAARLIWLQRSRFVISDLEQIDDH